MTNPKQNNQFVVDDPSMIELKTQPNVLTFDADDYKVTKRSATIMYKEPLLIQQYHTLIFKIDGKEYVLESTDRRKCN